jgi:pyruvate dehydrogenase E1 component
MIWRSVEDQISNTPPKISRPAYFGVWPSDWTFLHALGNLGKPGGSSASFRLSTRPVDPSLANLPEDAQEREQRRRMVLAGGYRLRPLDDADVSIAVMGALVPEALAAADALLEEFDVRAEVVCITSADLLHRALRARSGFGDGDSRILDALFPEPVPLVTVLDGHPHTLAFLGGVHAVPVTTLGVERFGQSGDLAELYDHHQIDTDSIVGAALDLVD